MTEDRKEGRKARMWWSMRPKGKVGVDSWLLIVGRAEFDMDLWKERAKYTGQWSNSSSAISKRFWRVLGSFTEEQKSQVVLFAWGRSRLPDRNTDWSFTIRNPNSHNDDQHLPIAHTCFFMIEMPVYSTDEIMRKRLLTAITFGTDITFA